MKKFVSLFILTLCFACVGCEEGGENTIKRVFDLPPGYELLSADYDAQGFVNCFLRKADTSYVAEEKKLDVFVSRTTALMYEFTFIEKYDYSDNGDSEKQGASINDLLNDGDTVIYNNNGFVVRRKVESESNQIMQTE